MTTAFTLYRAYKPESRDRIPSIPSVDSIHSKYKSRVSELFRHCQAVATSIIPKFAISDALAVP